MKERGKYKKEDRVEILKPQGYYYAIYYVDGVRYVESTRSKNVVQAVEKLKELKFRRDSGVVRFRRSQSLRLPELIEEFLDWYENIKKRTPTSVRRHHVASKPVLKFFRKTRVGAITPHLIEKYIQQRKAAPNTIRKEINLLSAVLGYAAKPSRGYIKSNPVPEVENKPSPKAVNPPRILSQEEIDKVLSAFKEAYHRLFFLILLYTGMRVSEAIKLEWSDVNFEAGDGVGEIVVRKAKRHKWRRIPLFEELREELLKVQPKIGTVIKHRGKKGYERGFYNVLDRVIKDTGVRHFSHHTLRHTFVSRCYQAGISDVVIASWTGHSVQVMRDIYLHLVGSDFQEIQKLRKFSRNKGK
ncbi:site-specific integrase [Acidobacteria bacterium AH-259-A15]|nr:site-specific integrase [Acidobacteria bacterium AH-259-A15]